MITDARAMRFLSASALLACCGAATFAQTVAEQLADGVVRVHADANAQSAAVPSLALLEEPFNPPAAMTVPVTPVFSTINGDPAVSIDLPEGVDFYGTGMASGGLRRNGRVTAAWTYDAFGYGDYSEELYNAHPWVLALLPDGSALGLLADTTHRVTIDLSGDDGTDVLFVGEGPTTPLIVIEGDSPQQVLERLGAMTGTISMPPLWALGYHQSRYSYVPQSSVLDVAQEFRARNIPLDSVWIDIDYKDGFRAFTFNPLTFPDPAQLDADLESIGVRLTAILDAHTSRLPGFGPYDDGTSRDIWIKNADGVTDYVGDVWPGPCVFPDFTMVDARDWWAENVEQFLLDSGIDGVWNDMNEPAVFRYPERTMPLDNIHRAESRFGGPATHERFHNVWGMLNARATVDGFESAYPGRRPFVLTRANYIGGQRYAAGWTGDNGDDWYHIDTSIPMTLNLGLSGMPFIGPDIGGFIGNSSPDRFARWMGFGSMLPFARGHTGGGPKEPWSFGAGVETTSRLAIQRRYRLLPHIYTAFREAHLAGQPVARPLFFLDPANPELRENDESFLLGDGLIVASSPHPEATPGVPDTGLPLYQFGFDRTNTPGSGTDVTDADLPYLYAVGGHIIATQPYTQSTAEPQNTEITLIVALDENGEATGTMYEDAGEGYGFLSGDFLLTTYRAERTGDTVTVTVDSTEGNRARPNRPLTVRVLTGQLQEATATGTDGQTIIVNAPVTEPVWTGGLADPVDGRNITADFPAGADALQANPTGFGDNRSELNGLYLRNEPTGLRLGVTGNLEPNFNGLCLFVDTDPGGPLGQQQLNFNGVPTPPSGPDALTGLDFAPDFRPDIMYFINNGEGVLYADRFTLEAGIPVGQKRYLGRTTINSGASLLIEGANTHGVRLAYDNDNRLGVTENSADANAAANVNRGLEAFIPFADLDLEALYPCGEIRVMGFVMAPNGFISNQFLPSLPFGAANVGFDRGPAADAAAQSAGYASVTLAGVADVGNSTLLVPTPDGKVDLVDFSYYLSRRAQADPAADLTETGTCNLLTADGVVDLSDFSCYLAFWSQSCSSN
ncbi:MAG: TIM-barrel domain-containing protein [Planctomycetota bacterium]